MATPYSQSDSTSDDAFDPEIDPEQWIKSLQDSNQSSYEMMAIEVWSIAKTMDKIYPGFWSRFMANRQTAMKQFLEQKQSRHGHKRTPPAEI